MAFGLKKITKKLSGKRKDAAKDEVAVKDKEEQPSLESAYGEKSQGNSHKAHHNSKEEANEAEAEAEAGSSYSKMAHSLDHSGTTDCTSAPPCPKSHLMKTTDKKSTPNQREALAQHQGPSTAGQVFPNSKEGSSKGYEHNSSALNGEHHSAVPAVKGEPLRPVNREMDDLRTKFNGSALLPRSQELSAVTVSRDAIATVATNTCTPTAQPQNHTSSRTSIDSSLQASTAAPAAVVSAPTDEPQVQPADRPLPPANQESRADTNSTATDGETNNLIKSDTIAAQHVSSPATTDGDLPNSVDHEGAVSENGKNRISEQQQSLTAFPTQVEPEPTVSQHTTVTAGEEIPQQEERINYENFFVSERISGDKFIQDKLAVGLDRTSHRVIKNWEHLACTDEINAPLKVRLKCKMVRENSCTLMLFEVLTTELEDKTVKDVVDALTKMKRNDVKKIITDVYPNAADSSDKFGDFVASLENSELIENMTTLLDQKSTVNQYWLHLGQQFKLSNERLKEIEYGPFNPTEDLMKYLYSKKTDLTIGEFYDEVKKLKRHDVLKKLDPFIVEASDRDKPMKNVIGLESDDMRSICVCLNNPNRAIKSWRHLCKSPALGIPEDVYKDCEPRKHRSPTDSLFEWIFANKVNLTVGQLCNALAKIDRNDIVRVVREHFEQNSSGQLGQG